ncbi:biotin--protein ligase [Cylas formicarius]|uniref:biotin--protein ligase n=1 Tax=Cylas formicarius TaxID=197179 RepID=UPI002958AFE0|nr:biotin--protein ligase [Cylas formicarius]
MIFTLYYMYATLLQWWRLGALKNKLNGTLNSKNAILVCDEKVVYDTRKPRSFENLLFRNENRIGCTVVPKQKINLSSQWVIFPKDCKYFPIYFKDNRVAIESPNIYIWIQAVLDNYTKHHSEILQVENFGELIAWKVTDHFELILKSDLDKLTKLVQCFSQSDCDINHELQLLRLETVDVDGKPKKIKFERKFSTDTTVKYSHRPIHWRNFVCEVKHLYSKIRDATNPKITIDNGSAKSEELKKVPVSEVKPIKKERKGEDKNTLEVNSNDYRRHKSPNHHGKSETDNKSERHKNYSPKKEPKESGPKDDKDKAREPRKHSKTRVHASKEHPEPGSSKEERKSSAKIDSEAAELNGEKKKGSKGDLELAGPKKSPGKDVVTRSSSKEKKLTRSTATYDDPEEDKGCKAKTKDDRIEEKKKKHKPMPQKDSSPVEEMVLSADAMVPRHIKPPNVLVYADSVVAKDNVKAVLANVLNRDKYTIYDLPDTGKSPWTDSTALVVVCGAVESKLAANLMKFLFNGGQLLCLCSDLLYSVLHTFTTAEVREHELVRFSYGKWKRVKMMHHIFCYQASPAKKQFSKDSDASNHSSGNGSSPIAPRTPSAVEIQHNGKEYTIQVQVLGAEETWQTPSLLLATVKGSEGRAIFSQVHLEISPSQYEDDESRFEALKESDPARLDILKDILSNHLDLDCGNPNPVPDYTPAYFLGRHDLKLKMLSECPYIKDNKLEAGDLGVVFCGKDDRYDSPSRMFLPVLVHACPSNFSTVTYFETLETKYTGRLVLYSDVLSSTHQIVGSGRLANGLAVITRQQVSGVGRSNNVWISPAGSAIFSLQLDIPMASRLGKALALTQHLVMVAVVSTVKNLTEHCEHVKIGIKWPNDLYVNGAVKIGGVIVTSTVAGDTASVNIGCGINLSNSNPTTCVNDVIKQVNGSHGLALRTILFETFLASVFNEFETLVERFQSGDVEWFYDLYYKYWLHKSSSVVVTSKDGKMQKVKVVGIDDYGFLKVQTSGGDMFSVQPDGNSYDIMKGLIYPKSF